FWVISSTHNIAHVKPAKEGAATNMNLVTASGAVYSFLLTEKGGTGMPDLKVYVNADPSAPQGKPKYYSAAQGEDLQSELTEAKAQVEAAKRQATESIAAYQQQYPSKLQFIYGSTKYEKPFFVRSIWHDGQFAYIKADASELPALYEVKDGKPALLNFQVHEGTYVVPKVLDKGYLALGKERFEFLQQWRERMADTPQAASVKAESPGAAVTDHRPVPRGVLPRGVQTWVMAGGAVVMLAIMLLVGTSHRPPHTAPPSA